MTAATDRPHLLLVDDTKTNLTILVATLRQEYKLAVATNGAEALSLVHQHPPDLILLDVMMPEMDGYEVCARLKAEEANRGIPVIFVTALTEIQDKERGFALGAVDYITKPFEPVEVRARVATHLQIVQYRRELELRNQALEQAQALLRHQVRELEARDRLVHAQTSLAAVAPASEEIVRVCGEAVNATQVVLYRPDLDGRKLVVEATMAPQTRAAMVPLETDSLLARALRQRQLQRGSDGQVTVPLLYGKEVLAVLSVEGLSIPGVPDEEGLNTLWRLATESALVLHLARLAEQLDQGSAEMEALLADDPG